MRQVFFLLALPLALSSVRVQAQAVVRSEAEFLTAPGGAVVAVVRAGAEVKTGSQRGPLTQVTIAGYVNATALGGKRDTFVISIKAPSGAILRGAAKLDGKPIAKLNDGMGLVRDSKTGDWSQVHRTGWIATKLLQQKSAPSPVATTAAPRNAAPAAAPAAVIDTTPLPNAMTPVRRTSLSSSPQSKAVASVDPGARIEPLARDRGFVKVRVEGWIREADLTPADPALESAVTSADLRADPDGWRGKSVRWDVQIIAFQLADALRKELALDEPYLLARGPGEDNSLLYLALPPTLVEAGKRAASPPMKHFIITARVRTAKSDPSGVPILEVLSLTAR